MFKDTARIILTLECPRSCGYCVNRQPGILDQATTFVRMSEMVAELVSYRAACLTGGEPMLVMPRQTIMFAKAIKAAYPWMRVYAYVSSYQALPDMRELVGVTDGVNYTLHASMTNAEAVRFHNFQVLATRENGSHRLVIHPSADRKLVLETERWREVKFGPWPRSGECRLPDNEDLFIWARPGEPRQESGPTNRVRSVTAPFTPGFSSEDLADIDRSRASQGDRG